MTRILLNNRLRSGIVSDKGDLSLDLASGVEVAGFLVLVAAGNGI
jgi:hypothetical protein